MPPRNSLMRRRSAMSLPVVAVIAIMVAGCSGGTPPASPTPTLIGATEPAATAPAAAPDAYQFNVDKATVDQYLAMSQVDFLALPIEQRVLVSMYYAESMPAFAADWYSVSENSLDNQLPVQITREMTPQQIATFNDYLTRIPYTLAQPDGYHLDTNAANKMIAGNLSDGTQSPLYQRFIDETTAFANDGGATGTARSLPASNYLTATIVNAGQSPQLLKDDKGYFLAIDVTGSDGKDVVTGQAIYRWIVASNGVGIWIR